MLAFFRWILRALRSLFSVKSQRKKLSPPRSEPREKPPRTRRQAARDEQPSRVANEDRVRVEYSPSLDGEPDPGEVVWTWVAFEDDPSQGKDRPVLLIGRRAGSLVGVALTSKRHDRAPQVEVGMGSWDREQRVSYAKVDRLVDVDASRVRREGAVMDKAVFDRVIRAVRELHGALIAKR